MKPKKRHGHATNRTRFKWWIRNNFVFFVIAGIICIVIGIIFGMTAFNYDRVKSVESILGKDLRTVHRVTGMTDEDVEKLRKEHPDFNWEGTWDSQRWKSGVEGVREANSRNRAREDFSDRQERRRKELQKRQRVPTNEWK